MLLHVAITLVVIATVSWHRLNTWKRCYACVCIQAKKKGASATVAGVILATYELACMLMSPLIGNYVSSFKTYIHSHKHCAYIMRWYLDVKCSIMLLYLMSFLYFAICTVV